MYLQRRPCPALEPYVEALWCCAGYQVRHRRERVLPNGRFQLILDVAEQSGAAIVIGMRTKHSILDAAGFRSVTGVVFRPGGARAFFRPPAHEFRAHPVALDQLWSSDSTELREQLLEAADPAGRLRVLETGLLRQLRPEKEPHGAVRYALGKFADGPHMAGILEVARETGLSRRRLAGLFREQVGLPPKLYCRLSRFQQVVRRIASGAPVNWAQVSLDGGYCDQSHMAHEFREFSGMAPGGWLASERPFLNHAVED